MLLLSQIVLKLKRQSLVLQPLICSRGNQYANHMLIHVIFPCTPVGSTIPSQLCLPRCSVVETQSNKAKRDIRCHVTQADEESKAKAEFEPRSPISPVQSFHVLCHKALLQE